MKVPALDDPQRYRGLYIFDFGEWSAVGYTAEEVAILLESAEYRAGKVYKIVRITPDGTMELRGVARTRFDLESGMFFNRDELVGARADYEQLVALAEAAPLPCRAYVQLADRGLHEGVARYVTVLIYPAEYEDEIARWLLDAAYAGGDTAEGGPSHVTNYHHEPKSILARAQLCSVRSTPARTVAEVLGSVRQAVQR
jgi:hypothetical protein